MKLREPSLDLFSTPIKPKRHRRTKAEMEAFRKGQLDSLIVEVGKDKGKPKKVAQKPSTAAQCPVVKQHSEASDPILDSTKGKMITYAHEGNPKGTRYRQNAKYPIPKWAVDIKDEVELKPKYIEYVEGKVVEGWVNVYKGGHGEYWLGSDLHNTPEEAKDVVGRHHNAKQLKIVFEEF